MEFGELQQRILVAYGRGAYAEALDLVREARLRFPDRDWTLTFYEACLLALAGDPSRSLAALQAGLDRGLAWDPRMLADPDLDSARTLDAWQAIEHRSAGSMAGLTERRPQPLSRNATYPKGTLIALHGAGEIPEEFFAIWEAATPADWTLIAPVGDVPMPPDRWGWPFDLSTESLIESLRDQPLKEPVVMSGFSQGARLAAKVAWNGSIEVSELILSAPVLRSELWDESREVPVPLYAVVGTEDLGYEACMATAKTLEKAGVPVHLDIRQGLGHALPHDLDRVVGSGLAWLEARFPT